MALIDTGKAFDKEANHKDMMERMGNMDVSPYLFRIPAKLHKEVKVKLAQDDKKLREVLIEALEHYVRG